MKNISIDIETFSSVDLGKCGVYKYAESPDFEILLFGYSVDGGPVQVVDLASGEQIPCEILAALMDSKIQKWAFNAQFERICLSRYLSDLGVAIGTGNGYLNPDSWFCSMVWSATLGLPLSLEGVGAVLGLEKQKLTEGKTLIRYFCIPCSPTKTNGGRARNYPTDDPEKWKKFKVYNLRDVETEMGIQSKLSRFPVSGSIWLEYHLDQVINDRGIGVDMPFVHSAIDLDGISRELLTNELQKKTGLENPNSVMQMKEWLSQNGLETDTLGKKAVEQLIKESPEDLAEVLKLRQQLAKSSVKKYTAILNAVCRDSRVRGMFQFYGANRTGRFAGRLVQLQNLPQNHMSDLEAARGLIRVRDYEAVSLLYDNIPDTLSQLIRTAFVPQNGNKFIVSDFSAIEARALAWLAGEQWRMDVFEQGKDIYCSSASHMFGVPVEKHGINGHLRQKGKIAELALGYGGSVGALKAMGALEMGLSEDELQPLVNAWRNTNPAITDLWWEVDRCVKETVKYRVPTKTHGIRFSYESGFLFITLPSGRRLAYVKPRIGKNQFGSESVTYEGVGGTKKWERLESYGPKFVENITQAIARDILMYSMKTLEGYAITAHVHDELIIECPKETDLDYICKQMGKTPPWADGLVLRADGYECEFYKKD
ncbi:MAG: DNA polymerase [Allobaculum sp.]|uniref:DNA polymerase n=1 Tax=Allobaculum sp. TaxID=1872463 RepID=UPI00399ADCEB